MALSKISRVMKLRKREMTSSEQRYNVESQTNVLQLLQ